MDIHRTRYKPWYHIKPDPLGESRNPFQVFIMLIACISGLASMIPGFTSASSVSNFLHEPFLFIWGLLLFLGGTITLTGMYWQRDIRDGLLLKRIGLVALASPTAVYAIILFGEFDAGAAYVAMTLAGFSVAAIVQAHRVNKTIKKIIRHSQSRDE